MKKKLIILSGLIILLVVLFVLLLKQKNNNNEVIPYINLGDDWKLSNNINDVFINENDIDPEMKKIIEEYECVDGAGAYYYFNVNGAQKILNGNFFWKSVALAVLDVNSCWDVYKFSIKTNEGWMIKTLSKNITDLENEEFFFNQKKTTYFNEFDEKLEVLNIRHCSDPVPGRGGNAPSGGALACIENDKQLQYNTELCQSGPTTLEIGRDMYPISNSYLSSACQEYDRSCVDSDNILGELFSASDCGEERLIEIYGESGDFHPYALKIKGDRYGHYFVDTLKEVGFECAIGDENDCREWLLNKQVKIDDLLKLKEYYNNGHFSMDDVYLEHIDLGNNNESRLYKNENFKFEFILPEEFLIKEKGNNILFTNSELEKLSDQNIVNCNDTNTETICIPGFRLDLLSLTVLDKDEFFEKLNSENIEINNLSWQYFQAPDSHGDIYFQIKYNNLYYYFNTIKYSKAEMIKILSSFSFNGEAINNIKNQSQIKLEAGESLYTSDKLGVRFKYAKIDPFSDNECIITETGNRIENSCGLYIDVIKKDINSSANQAISSLIPDSNYCNIEPIDSITNFNEAYRITPKAEAFSEPLDISSDLSVCGKYVSRGSSFYRINYNEDFPDRLVITHFGGHEPAGTLYKTENEPVKLWVNTVEIF